MTVVIKHYCDWPGCGKEFVKHAAPWEPDYCPEHMAKYRERQKNFNTYVAKPDPDMRVWYNTNHHYNMPKGVIRNSTLIGYSMIQK